MSQANLETFRSSYDLWWRGDFDAWLETIDPEIGWDISTHPLPDVQNRGHGREAWTDRRLLQLW